MNTQKDAWDTVCSATSGQDGLSDSDLRDLPRVIDDIPIRLWIVALIGFWERFTFWGLTAPWQNYMENVAGDRDVPGQLGLGQSVATRIYCAFYIFYYVTPIFFAVLSDTRLGRLKTLIMSVILYVIGCGVLFLSSFPAAVDAGLGFPGLILAMVLVGLGGGGFKMIMVPFIADQYTERHPKLKTLSNGERVLTDRTLTIQYIYNLYYWVGNVGSLSWFATTYLEKKVSFTVAYGLTLGSMVVAMAVLLAGAKWYISIPPEGNVLPTATRIIVLASRNHFKMGHTEPDYQFEHHQKTVTWTAEFVGEIRMGLQACRVLIGFIIFFICFDQMQNNLISQAKQMKTHGVPNDMMPAINQVACIAIGPAVQYGLYPFLQKRRINFNPIARITVGFGFIALSMLYATVTQVLIYAQPPCFKHPRDCTAGGSEGPPNTVDVWVQTPIYIFIAIGEIFAYVTALEYAYDHSPKDMKALVQAFSLLIAGIGSVCAMGLTPIARDPLLVYLYGGLTVAMAVTAVVFWCLFRKYDGCSEDHDEEKVRPYDETTSWEESGNRTDVNCTESGMRNFERDSDATLVELMSRNVSATCPGPASELGQSCRTANDPASETRLQSFSRQNRLSGAGMDLLRSDGSARPDLVPATDSAHDVERLSTPDATGSLGFPQPCRHEPKHTSSHAFESTSSYKRHACDVDGVAPK